MYNPTLREFSPHDILAASTGRSIWNEQDWIAWTRSGYLQDGRVISRTASASQRMRKSHKLMIKLAAKRPASRVLKKPAVMKRPATKKPAAVLPLLMQKKPLKRTPITLKRKKAHKN